MDAARLLTALHARGVRLLTGVPDSLLHALSSALPSWPGTHLPAANEGNAIGLAMGHYLGTGRPACVYMQNSGLGNAVNPLVSLADPDVYSVPVLLVVGFRGEPGTPDEPQHIKQGRITRSLLDVLEIPYWLVEKETDEDLLDAVFAHMAARSGPVALLVRKGGLTYSGSGLPAKSGSEDWPLTREQALACVLDKAAPEDLLVATTGKTGRELYELRLARGESPDDFLTVGGMGHTASIALGAALGCPDRRVICLDGDGSLLMHMGGAALCGHEAPRNLVHIVLNNLAHESVGGQPTIARGVDFSGVLRACGYAAHWLATTEAELHAALRQALTDDRRESPTGPCCVEVRCNLHSRPNLGRPAGAPADNKVRFMHKAAKK